MRAAAYAAITGTLVLGGYCACFLGGADAPICPPDLQPTFGSINHEILATASCGTNGSGCHSHDGALNSGGLDLSTDPYHALLGADGGGAPAENIAGNAGHPLLRVVPGDPANSFLVIKLTTTSSSDPRYGSGMPFNAPGSICPSAIETIEQWIDAGARND